MSNTKLYGSDLRWAVACGIAWAVASGIVGAGAWGVVWGIASGIVGAGAWGVVWGIAWTTLGRKLEIKRRARMSSDERQWELWEGSDE